MKLIISHNLSPDKVEESVFEDVSDPSVNQLGMLQVHDIRNNRIKAWIPVGRIGKIVFEGNDIDIEIPSGSILMPGGKAN